METLILLEKRTHLLRLLQAFQSKPELSIVEIRRKIPSTVYYQSLLSKMAGINLVLHEKYGAFFIRPTFFKEGEKILNGLEKNPLVSFELKDNLIVLTLQRL